MRYPDRHCSHYRWNFHNSFRRGRILWGGREGFARPLPEGKPELDRLSLLSEDFQRADCSRLQHFPHFPAMLQERFFCLPEKFPERLLASSKELLKRLHCLTRGRQSFPGSSSFSSVSVFSSFISSFSEESA